MNGGGRITVVSWSEEDLLEGGEELNWWGGFFERGMRWKDYLDNFEKELHPYLEAARRSAVENQIRAKGPEHQYEGVTPVFSDGAYFALTFRAWGDFMAAVWAEEDNTDRHYMDFYM